MSAVLPYLVETAKTDPDRLALVWNNQEVSYRAFVARIAADRAQLATHGLEPGRIAAVWTDYLVLGWAAILALQSLGLITIAIRSAEELDALELPGLDYLVIPASRTMPSLVGSHRAARMKCIVTTPFSGDETTLDPERVHLPAGGGHILSSSGTTGAQKRVLIDLERQAGRIASATEVLGADPAMVYYLGNLGLWTVGGFATALYVWANGGAGVLDQRSARHLSFAERRITHALLVPSELEAVLLAPADQLRFGSGTQIFIAGGALPWRLAEQAMARLTPQVWTMLGSTENGAIAITRVYSMADLLTHDLDRSRVVEIVDEDDRVLPTGEPGRIRIGFKPGDADGYLNDETTTRTVFRNGFFYPGDLGALDGDRRLTLHGRATDVINVRGDKIATLPFEQSIVTHTGARGACILSETEFDGEATLHIALELDRPLTDVEGRCLADLTPDWLPQIHIFDALPRNDMGKVNRVELRRRLFGDGAATVARPGRGERNNQGMR